MTIGMIKKWKVKRTCEVCEQTDEMHFLDAVNEWDELLVEIMDITQMGD